MVFPQLETLHTPRLTLRKVREGDIEDYFHHLGSSPAVTKYMLFDPHRDISESAASIQKALNRYAAGRCYRWAIALKEEDTLFGIIELLRFDEEVESCSFAYMLGQDYWGKGYGTETLKAALAFAFEKMQVREVVADHFSANPASGAAMRKAGMTHVRTLPGKYEKHGLLYDAEEYRITRKQWQSIP